MLHGREMTVLDGVCAQSTLEKPTAF